MRTIDRITQMLELLSLESDGMMISDISEQLDLPLSTTHRMLNAFKKNGYIHQDEVTKKYRLGIKILTLSMRILNNMDVVKISRPFLDKLSSKQQLLVFLTVLEKDKSVCVDMINNSKKMRFYVQIGSLMPANCSASTQAILAFKDDKEINRILNGEQFQSFTSYTKMSISNLKKYLFIVRQQGYAVCDEEMELGVKAISVPIRNINGEVSASITIIYIKFLDINEDHLIEDLKNTGKAVSRAMGFV